MTIILLGYESHSTSAAPKVLYAGRKKSEMLEKMQKVGGKIVRFEIIENPRVVRKSNPNADAVIEQAAAEKEAREQAAAKAEAAAVADRVAKLEADAARVAAERAELIAGAEAAGDESTLEALLTDEEREAKAKAAKSATAKK